MERTALSTDPKASRPSGDALSPGLPVLGELPRRHPRPRRGVADRLRSAPLLQLILYYAVLIGVGAVLAREIPVVREALFSPVALPFVGQGEAIFTGAAPPPAPPAAPRPELLGHVVERGASTLLVILGALALVVPVARVYMQTKRLQYDPALVHSIIILPIVVAGIALVVKNSVALAFSLAGIVAAVRFRNTLKDPRDAVYIFLVIGIGLSAGVQALDVALVMSILFNLVVLTLARMSVGSVYAGRYGRTGVVAAGDATLLIADSAQHRHRIRRALLPETDDMDDVDGILLVHTQDTELARHTVQETLGEMAKDWKLAGVASRGPDLFTLEYLVKLKKKAVPTEMVGALRERWSEQVGAAEYFWFHAREREREQDGPKRSGKGAKG